MVYEAGPTGYGLARRAWAEGIEMLVCAPGRADRDPTDRVKTDKRDAIRLARRLAAGELTFVTVPSVEHEQLRDLVRCREDIRADLMRARHRLGKFLLRREIYYQGPGKAWSLRHRKWLASLRFKDPASQLTMADYLHAQDVLVARRAAAVVGAEREPEGSVEAAITRRSRDSGSTLLVLDNMEHVLAAAGTLCGLLDGLPDVQILATSRMPLRVDRERVIALEALDERSALELIARSVGRRGLQPALSGAGGDALREIVRLVDGLPLALELAAARLSMLTAVHLRDRLRESIDVLGEARGGRPARQRSLRAVLDSTLALLDPSARALFVRMGAFAGLVELAELERVLSGDGVGVLEALAELLDAALLRRVETGDGKVRFGLRTRRVRSPQNCWTESPMAGAGGTRTRNDSTSWCGPSAQSS
jgi:Transposase